MAEFVDPARRALELDSDELEEAQLVRPKQSIEQVEEAGITKYVPNVRVVNPTTEVDVTVGGAAVATDDAAQIVKLRLGAEGVNDLTVDGNNPVPTRNDRLLAAVLRQNELLEMILDALTR